MFILAGQSNMLGHANLSTFDSMADDQKTASILKEMRNADGTPRVCKNVWISSIGCAGNDTTEQQGQVTADFGASTEEIGPEFTFGVYKEYEKPGSQKYFRQAQAALGLLPELKGNVVAVQTAPFWDDDLETLRARLEALWPKMDARAAEETKKNPKMTGVEVEAVKMQVVADNFTPEERQRLKATSNGGYHYLGAARIIAPIGKAFAEAMANLKRPKKQK